MKPLRRIDPSYTEEMKKYVWEKSEYRIRIMDWKGYNVIIRKEACIWPKFQMAISNRMKRKMATNICIVGEAGSGKSFAAINIARLYEGVQFDSNRKKVWRKIYLKGELVEIPKDRFKVDQIVFTHSEYMRELQKKRMGRAIVFDEPSYSIGKRDWHKQINKSLVLTMESQRFMVRLLIIPVISMSLLDRTIRSHLIQFQVNMKKRGHATVNRISTNPYTDKTYYPELCQINFKNIRDFVICRRESCLACKWLGDNEKPTKTDCGLLIAQYERKKMQIQSKRYESAEEQAQTRESQELTEEQLEKICFENINDITIRKDDELDSKISIPKMRLFLREQGIRISTYKAYKIKNNLELMHENL